MLRIYDLIENVFEFTLSGFEKRHTVFCDPHSS